MMCTLIAEQVAVTGNAVGVPHWMKVTQVNVFYDHPVEAPFDHAMIIDFVNPSEGVGVRVSVELDAASALGLMRAIETALSSPEAVRDLVGQSPQA
jgi:hypothetical protein